MSESPPPWLRPVTREPRGGQALAPFDDRRAAVHSGRVVIAGDEEPLHRVVLEDVHVADRVAAHEGV